MELIVNLHGKHAATLEAGDDRWLHAEPTGMGPMSAPISAAWAETSEPRQLERWLDGCLPENGLLGRYRGRAKAMLQAAGVACETPKAAQMLCANADAEFAGAIRTDTHRTRSAAARAATGPSIDPASRPGRTPTPKRGEGTEYFYLIEQGRTGPVGLYVSDHATDDSSLY